MDIAFHRAEYREFLAAEARHEGALRRRVNQRVGDMAECLVTCLVAECVIDALEPVNVDKEKGKLFALIPCCDQALRCLVREVTAIGEACQVVRIGKALDPLMQAVVPQFLANGIGLGKWCNRERKPEGKGKRMGAGMGVQIGRGQPCHRHCKEDCPHQNRGRKAYLFNPEISVWGVVWHAGQLGSDNVCYMNKPKFLMIGASDLSNLMQTGFQPRQWRLNGQVTLGFWRRIGLVWRFDPLGG